jgi:murein DD-endopeptidase MepM/ murein hydrolase activator NlpD
MASDSFDSRWIFGLHDPGGEQLMLDVGKPGWIVFTEAVGRDARDQTGRDFRPYSARALGVICRINHGYYPDGTLPSSRYYAEFAQRCANFVAASPGCRLWIIGNETNFEIERPFADHRQAPAQALYDLDPQASGVGWWARLLAWIQRTFAGNAADAHSTPMPALHLPPDDLTLRGLPQRFSALLAESNAGAAAQTAAPQRGEPITPALYAECYRLCRDAIHRLRGHEQDRVLVAAPAPWNNQTRYPGNERGDWVQYWVDILDTLGPDHCDGLTLHTYTHGASPAAITNTARMQPPFADRHYNFRTYQDFLSAVPLSMRDLPVYITETDQIEPWTDANTGWVQAAYREIDGWNRRTGTQKVRALVLYRWARHDKWYMDGKQGVIADLRSALQQELRWDHRVPQPAGFQKGNRLRVLGYVNLRRTPGYVGKGPEDRILELAPGQIVQVTDDGSAQADGLLWWRVQVVDVQPPAIGWMAQNGPDGAALLELSNQAPPPAPPPLQARLGRGQTVRTTTVVNARRTPGFQNKAPDDILQEIGANTLVRLADGPQFADGLVWWFVRREDGTSLGWTAENAVNGTSLLELVDATTPPPPGVRFRPGDRAMTVAFVRLRRTPGYLNKPSDDVIADIWQGTPVVILSGPRTVDELIWWEVETTDISGKTVRGWMAESAPGGIPLLDEWVAEDRTPFKIGDFAVVGPTPVRVRRSPGYLGKAENDVLGEFSPRTTLYLLDGPRQADNLAWWRVSGVTPQGKVVGWVAQGAPNGATLVGRAAKLPGTEIPDQARGLFLATPYRGQQVITQLWGENPAFYARYSYDGVALLGHNGIDFGTPRGTPILATDGGQVIQVGWEPTGFGNFVMLAHAWGQSVYGHLDTIGVQMGRTLSKGESLGLSGSTGSSSGPHLHFAIRIHPFARSDGWGGYSDPLPYLNPREISWPLYMMDAPPRPSEGTMPPQSTRRPPPAMADDAPGYIRP